MTLERSDAVLPRWFRGIEHVEISEQPNHLLLEQTWSVLKTELESRGNSPEFINLRRLWADKLKAWWLGKRHLFYSTVQGDNSRVRIGDEEILLPQGESYLRDEEISLNMVYRNPLEEAALSLTVDRKTGLDTFLNRPTITCRVREKQGGDYKTYWEVVFKDSAISTITKASIHHPSHGLPSVKQIETLDASLFGVDYLHG